jgi:hypothetical protein
MTAAGDWCLSKEMRLLVVQYACASRRPYVISEFLSMRSALRASSREFAYLVDSHAPFWDRILYTPHTPDNHILAVVDRPRSRRLDLVLRFSESVTADPSESRVETFMSRALLMLDTVFTSSAELTIEAPNSQVP